MSALTNGRFEVPTPHAYEGVPDIPAGLTLREHRARNRASRTRVNRRFWHAATRAH